MTELSNEVRAILDEFETSTEPFSEHDIGNRLRPVIAAISEPGELDLAELFAFCVIPSYQDETTSWGTYYGPSMVFSGREWPSYRSLTAAAVSHWTTRSCTSKNPLFRARYADLIWDFSRLIINERPPIQVAQTAIDASLQAVQSGVCRREIEAIERLQRALRLALSIRDRERTARVRDVMIVFEEKTAVDELPGTWGFCYESLLVNKKVPLEEAQRNKIVGDLESRLQRLSEVHDATQLNTHAIEIGTLQLVGFFRRENRPADVHRVLLRYGDACRRKAPEMAPMVAQHWLQRIFELYRNNGLTTEADTLTVEIEDYGRQAVAQMKPITVKTEIPREKMEAYFSALLDGDLPTVLRRVAGSFLPDPESARESLSDLDRVAPMSALASHSVVDASGRRIATIQPDDLDGRLIAHISQLMRMGTVFLRGAIERIARRSDFSFPSILDYILEAPNWRDNQRTAVDEGLRQYFDGNHLIAAHLLIPQLEASLRNLLQLMNGPIYRPDRHGGLRLRTMDEMLRDEGITSCLTARITSYLRLLLTDQRGWNVRNNIMHGFLDPDQINAALTDRVFHAVLLLADVREKHGGEEQERE